MAVTVRFYSVGNQTKSNLIMRGVRAYNALVTTVFEIVSQVPTLVTV